MIRLVRSFGADHKALALIAYGLIAALVSITSTTIMATMGGALKNFYTTISTTLATA